MLKNIFLVVCVSYFIIGCAKRPESIAASYVAPERYMNYSCKSLVHSLYDARFELNESSIQQNTKSNLDFLTVFLLAIPQSNIFGDKEALVARAKGNVEAIETALVAKKCMPDIN